MASARTKLDTRRPDEHGNYPAKIIIVSNQTNASISLNCCLPERFQRLEEACYYFCALFGLHSDCIISIFML